MALRGQDAPATGAEGDVCVIVLSWNGGALLTACLRSLRAQTHAVQIVVIDNASSDGSAQRVRSEFPDVILIENARNLGVAEGYNVGLRHALAMRARYALVLNQDTVLDAAMVRACVRAADADATIGAIGPLLLFASDRRIVNSAGIEMNAAAWAHDRGVGQPLDPRWQQGGEVLAASGGAMLLRSDALRSVGLFDADYFAYYEDVDLCLRLWAAGYRIVFAPEAIVLHHFSTAFGTQSPWKTRLFHSNRWRLALKHFELRHLLRVAPTLMRSELHLVLGSLAHNGWRGMATVLATYWIILSSLPAVVRYRRTARTMPAQRQRWWRLVSSSTAMPTVVDTRPE